MDIDALASELADVQSQVDSMLGARRSLKDRLTASEGAVTAALRAYSADTSDTALQRVDDAKEDEKQARKRPHTNNDSLALVQKDLVALKLQHDDAVTRRTSKRLAAIRTQREKAEPKQAQAVKKALLDILITRELQGTAVGIVDVGKVIHHLWPTYKKDVSAAVMAIKNEAKL